MKQRLIDANALHYRMGVNQDDKQIFYVTGEDIDAAPTIDPESLRPSGRWNDACYYHDRPLCYECSNCGLKLMYKPNYCPHCGAKMEDSNEG